MATDPRQPATGAAPKVETRRYLFIDYVMQVYLGVVGLIVLFLHGDRLDLCLPYTDFVAGGGGGAGRGGWGGGVAWRLMLALHCAYFHRRSDAFGPFRGVILARPESGDRPRATWAYVYPLISAVARPESACSARVHGSQGSSGWPLARDDDFYALCNTTWASYMQSLKDLCETGTGTPYPLG